MFKSIFSKYQQQIIILFCTLFVCQCPSEGLILYVATSGDDTNGHTWENAYHSVGKAILSSASGDVIWIKEGLYVESVTLIPGISIYGGFGGYEAPSEFDLRDWRGRETIISGTAGLHLPRYPVIAGADHTVVDGLTLKCGLSGIFCKDASMEVKNCYVTSNIRSEGGGCHCKSGRLTLDNCRFERNQGWDGVGVYLFDSTARMRNCLFLNHWTGRPDNPGEGGTVYLYGERSSLYMENCTLANNDEVYDYPGIRIDTFGESDSYIANSIIQGDNVGLTNVVYSNIESVTGEGNIHTDPLFRSPSWPYDYRLRAGSPCIDAGTMTTLLTDLDGNPRPIDVPAINNGPTAVDMGCYEFQLPKADLNGDGKVDAKDLFLFEQQWHGEE